MRYIVFFLLAANLAYFGWQLYSPPPLLPADTAMPRPMLNQGLVLLSEFNDQAAILEADAATPARLCYLVGDFNSIDEANSFLNLLQTMDYLAELHLAGEELPPLYRTYLPPASSREIATITLDGLSERLGGQNLQVETYLITRGLLENAVALGVYEELGEAQIVSDQVGELGYIVEIEVIHRSTGAIQLVMAKVDFTPLEIAEWLEFAGDRPDLTYSENLCETIAQGAQFP